MGYAGPQGTRRWADGIAPTAPTTRPACPRRQAAGSSAATRRGNSPIRRATFAKERS